MSPTTATEHDPAVDELLAQRDQLFELSLEELHRKYIDQPVTSLETFGEGNQAQITLRGNRQRMFAGVCILNPSPKVIYLGFGAGTSQGSPLFCPAGAALVCPGRFSEISLSVSPADAAGPAASITVIRLWWPTTPALYPYGRAGASAVTTASPRSIVVGVASGQVLAANATRRGLSIQNTGKASVSLGLGAAAIVGDDLVLEPGGSWDGTISGNLWRGQITAISAEAGSLAVVEV